MNRLADLALVVSTLTTVLTAGVLSGARPAAPSSPAMPAAVPVVVELFTSEGCSSCPAADAALRELETAQSVPGVEIIALGQHVDYWNRLGWRDPFSSERFTERQRQYAEALSSGTYTPQAVVNGQVELVGSQRGKLTAAIAQAARAPRAAVELSRADAELAVRVGAVPPGTRAADVLLAVTESGLSTRVGRGENAGRTLQHASVVRVLRPIGAIGADGTFSATVPLALVADWPVAHLRAVVLVQERESRRIVGAGSLSLGAGN